MTVDGDTLDVADVILLGMLSGEWAAFERQVELGLALEHGQPEAVTKDEVRREATGFRYAHGLISAADFLRWLEDRGMSVDELSQVLRRRLLRQRHEAPAGAPAAAEEIGSVLAGEAYCDGILGRLTELGVSRLVAGRLAGPAVPAGLASERLEQALAVAQGVRAPGIAELGEEQLRRRLERLIAFELALVALRDAVADQRSVARRIQDHALDWLELRGDELSFAREGAAREARLLIVADGQSAETVAARAGTAVTERSLLIDEAPAEMGGAFAATAAGEVIGPWREDGAWHVMQLREKVAPSAHHDALRARAIEELLADRIGRYAAGRTTRNAQL